MNMIKRLLVSTLVLFSLYTPTYADSTLFFRANVGPWSIIGKAENNKNDSCIASYVWQDGSAFDLIKDLADGEWYIVFTNRNWNIGDDPSIPIAGSLVSYFSNGAKSFNIYYELLAKDTVRARNLNSSFVDEFMRANRFLFVMPGTIPNAQLSLSGTTEVGRQLANCMFTYSKVKSERRA